MKIASRLYSLAELVKESPDWHFNVPIYQRLYVWGEDQVLTLLTDLVNAYEHREELFFLGGTLLVEQKSDKGRHFDLIDGQQRFTTLWLISHVWREGLRPFLTVTTDKFSELRLRFAIRPEVNRFLETLALGVHGQRLSDEKATKRMSTALDLMKSFFEKHTFPAGSIDRAVYLTGLTEFVFRKVKFIITIVPQETDLNKLFEVINNRGVQLQHHEILKARMLDTLPEVERGPFAIMWEACAEMENFIERSLGGISGLPANEVTTLYEQGEFADVTKLKARLQNQMKDKGAHLALSLDDILTSAEESEAPKPEAEDETDDPTWVRSIFGFPLFLQHTLRIWLLEHGNADLPRLLDRELLALFDTHFFGATGDSSENVRSFIDLLWQLRVIFDKHIIKWADQAEAGKIHLISTITISTSNGKRYMNRSRQTDSHHAFSLLQSMLYRSQEITTQYWVTPLLLFMYRNPDDKVELYFDYLRHLDNHLLGSAGVDSLVARTLSFMKDPWHCRSLIYQEELAKHNGVKFAHYWFYKLEFVLWFQEKREEERWKKFRFTTKSSVEHISPQTPTKEDDNRVKLTLDCFGNLALVTRSLNSEYSNLPFNEKRQKFIINNKNQLDSLKMALIYENEQWNDEKALAHQQEMIDCLAAYYAEAPKG